MVDRKQMFFLCQFLNEQQHLLPNTLSHKIVNLCEKHVPPTGLIPTAANVRAAKVTCSIEWPS